MFIQEIREAITQIGGRVVVDDGCPHIVIPSWLSRIDSLRIIELIDGMAYSGYGGDHKYEERNGDIYVFVSPD